MARLQPLPPEEVARVKKAHEMDLLSIPGIHGVKTAEVEIEGTRFLAIVVFAAGLDEKNHNAIPKEIEGVPVVIQERPRMRPAR